MNQFNRIVILVYLFLSIGISCVLLSCQRKDEGSSSPSSVSVMTYNIRYDNPGDSLNSWDNRRKRLANEVLFYDPDFLDIQEGLYHMVHYLKGQLRGRKYIGIGRKDGHKKGEFSAIFYDTTRFSLVSGTDSTLWLSSTPGKPSRGWDADLPRIVTWGKFRSKSTSKELYVFNTHFDHIGDTARVESAKLILKTIKKIAGDKPVVLTGDFNVPEQRKPYKILTSSFLNDAWHASNFPAVGPAYTSSGFDVCASTTRHGARIDYIFTNNALKVDKIATISNFNQGHFLSDHLPMYTQLSWSDPE